ncbi:hypothetical protein MOQ_003183 [Trypanosoma cruzi marinkellei]|uniref:Uncharacterized protein n=1 Tax=Trypanosoma cruzi marinkellei TaxID=85056 RepID=K2NVH5_TRYCR|nr:hypothetical protein MOQ_003183 [Trypanosoma cruzi marinkellei]
MDEKTLTRIVKNADAAALQTYIRDGRSPFSQPLEAQARFAYFHLSREGGKKAAVHGERRTVTSFEEYHGPATTVVVRSREKGWDVECHTPHPRHTAPVSGRNGHRPNLSESAWVIESNGWTEGILRHSRYLYSPCSSHDLLQFQRNTSVRASSHPYDGAARTPRRLSNSSGCGIREMEEFGLQCHSSLQEDESKRFLRELQRVEVEERRQRLKIEAAFQRFITDRRRGRQLLLDRLVRETGDLITAERIVRFTIHKEEHSYYKEILAKCLEDLMGCRWDGVRMECLRRQMTNSLLMHEWVVLNGTVTRSQDSRQDIAVGTEGCTWELGKVEELSPSAQRVDAQHHSLTPICATLTPQNVVYSAKASEAFPRAIRSNSRLPSRPRVLPPAVPHEECTVS